MSKIRKSLFRHEKSAGVCLAIEREWLKQSQAILFPTWGETLTMMHDLTVLPSPSLTITITTHPHPPSTIPQIYCFKSSASQHDSIMQSISLGWLFRREIFDDMRTLRDPFILIWENNCVSSLKSVACGLHISPHSRFCASCPLVGVCVCCGN